ncbi:MAG: hypothetical protein RQ756_06300 [Flavobacteriaceae bacterium]|nr:hypothetical protein [Flavobacteriaceae bacterium]
MKTPAKHSTAIFTWFIPGLILLFYALEAYQKLLGKDSIVTSIKAIVFFAFMFLCMKLTNKKFWISISMLCIIYTIGQWFTPVSFSYNSMLIFFKFLFPLFVLKSISNQNINKTIVFNTVEWLFVFNSALILIGLLLELSFFKTYSGSRFGFNGLLHASATSSYIYAIGLMYFILAYKKNAITNWKFLVIIASCIFIGTKTVYVFTFFTIVTLLLLNRKTFNKYLIGVCLGLISVGLFIYLFNDSIINSISREHGIVTAILSYRNDLLLNTVGPYVMEFWTWINYLFGGVSNFNLRAQMEIIDVFFFWGIIGGVFYYYLFYKLLITVKLELTSVFFIVLLSIAFALAGNFFTYSFVALFLAVLKLTLIKIKESTLS